MNFKCPHCHKPGITLFWKWRSYRRYPALCTQCGKESHGMSWLAALYLSIAPIILTSFIITSPLFMGWWIIIVIIFAHLVIISIWIFCFPLEPINKQGYE